MPLSIPLRRHANLTGFCARPISLLAAICLLLAALAAQAQGPDTGLSAQWQILGPTKPPTVGDVITLRLQVSHPADVVVELPALPKQWGDLEVRALRPGSPENARDGRSTTSLEIDAVLWSPGEHPLPPMNVAYRDAQGLPQELFVESGTITVTSVLDDDDLTPRDLKPQAEIPRPPTWPWVLAGALAAAGLGYLLMRLLQRRRLRTDSASAPADPVDHRPPHEIALEELDRIEGLRLAERGEFKPFYTLLTDCVRGYLERRYPIHAMDLTTGELLRDLARADPPEGTLTMLGKLLSAADLVKFAKWVPEVPDAHQGLATARHIVRLTTPAQPADTASERLTPRNREGA